MDPFTRRHLLRTTSLGGLALAGASALPLAACAEDPSLRARFHMTPPHGWLCDPQRPIVRDGVHHLYYLHSEINSGDGGWDRATIEDLVHFNHHGDAIPLRPDFPVWSGCLVVDEHDDAGYGAGAVLAYPTQPTDGIRKYQEQYLYVSHDDGATFTRREEPVIPNEDGREAVTGEEVLNAEWFRDPKIHWDAATEEWVCVIGRKKYAAFYTSTDLVHWRLRRNFDYLVEPDDLDLGGIECPDLFEITADDGTSHWVLGASMDAWGVGLPMTYAYWTGRWDGEQFLADDLTPQWLDWGWDWYAAVTWPKPSDPHRTRYAIAWMNNWKYANRDVPTDTSDGYNGQNSIIREIHLQREGDGRYALLSRPVPQLTEAARELVEIPDQRVDGWWDLPWSGRAYELELDLSWDAARNLGVSLGRSADGARHTNVGVHDGKLYVDRGPSDLAGFSFGEFTQAEAPIDPAARHVHLRIFVDTQSVEVFANAGHTVLSQQVHFLPGDTGIALHGDGGPVTASHITVRVH